MPVADPVQTTRGPDDHDRGVAEKSMTRRLQEIEAPEAKARPSAPLTAAEAVEPLERAARSIGRRVDVQYREDMNVVVMTVYKKDAESDEDVVVRQIPPEEALRLAQRLQEARSTILDEIA